jgi:hypothetical protein
MPHQETEQKIQAVAVVVGDHQQVLEEAVALAALVL